MNLDEHLDMEARLIVERGIVTKGQRLVVKELLLAARDEIGRLEEQRLSWEMTARTIYRQHERWQEMAELLWEELQEWHYDECPTQREPGCICHRILAAKWDEITNAGDWAHGPEDES